MLSKHSAEIQKLADASCARFSELSFQQVDKDPSSAARFAAFRASLEESGTFLRDAIEIAWNQARARMRANMSIPLHAPGEPAPSSGQYEIVDAKGLATGEERTAIQGKPLPPPPNEGERYRLVDSTRNLAGVFVERA